MPMRCFDVYIDVESLRSATPPELWWKIKVGQNKWLDHPEPMPYFEKWAEEARDAPKVRTLAEVKVGNRKAENAQKYREEQVQKDKQALADWQLGARKHYDEALAKHDAGVQRLWDASATSAFHGGRVGAIGLAIRASGSAQPGQVKLITPDNDPLRARERAEGPTNPLDGSKPLLTESSLWLALHREYMLLKRLSMGLQRTATWGGQNDLRLIAWNGFGFDFQFLALRAFKCLRPDLSQATDNVRQLARLDADGVDPDLAYLCALFWHTAPWKSPHLVDPRETWSFGDRFATGKLPQVARFLGYQPEGEPLTALNHADIPRLLEKGSAADRELVYAELREDVAMLQHVHMAMEEASQPCGPWPQPEQQAAAAEAQAETHNAPPSEPPQGPALPELLRQDASAEDQAAAGEGAAA